MPRIFTAVLLAAAVGGCALPGAKIALASGGLPAPEPANTRSRLYADCVHQAAAPPADSRVETFGHLIRFHCNGAPAQALYEAMGVFSAHRGWVDQAGGAETRYISPRKWDDQCRREGEAYTCRLHLNVGPFLDPGEDLKPPVKP